MAPDREPADVIGGIISGNGDRIRVSISISTLRVNDFPAGQTELQLKRQSLDSIKIQSDGR